MTNKTASDAQGAYTFVKRQTHTEMMERYGNYSFWIESALSLGFRLLLNPSLKKNPIFQSLRPETLESLLSLLLLHILFHVWYVTAPWWVSFKPHHLCGYTLVQVTTISHLYCCMSPSTGLHVSTLSPSFRRSFLQQKSQNHPVKTLSQTMSLLCLSPSKDSHFLQSKSLSTIKTHMASPPLWLLPCISSCFFCSGHIAHVIYTSSFALAVPSLMSWVFTQVLPSQWGLP